MRLPALVMTLLLSATPALAAEMTLYKSSSCGCCQGWAAYMAKAGWQAKIIETDDLDRIKSRHGLPSALQSCHTAIIDGYVVEGHVPLAAIDTLLRERPHATGIAAPGMPQGSPGMSGRPEPFDVILFGPEGQKIFRSF